MRDLERLLRLAGRRPEPSATGRGRAHAAIHDAWTQQVRLRSRRRWTIVTLPALAAAAAVIAVTLPWRAAPPVATRVVGTVAGRAVHAGTVLHAGPGEFTTVTLEGGGELRMNGGASVQMAGVRQVTLTRGQIYVDAGAPDDPDLAITTPAGVLRDLGTRFDVVVDGSAVRVRVRDGVVRLTSAGMETDARAGQQLVTRPDSRAIVEAAVTHGPDWDWILKAAPFATDGARLEAFLRWVEIDGGLIVEFPDPALRRRIGATVLHGSIAGLGLEDALAVILPVSGLAYRVDGARIIVTAAGGI